MASYASIRARQTATPIFRQARAMERRLTSAIALGTFNERRLRTLRGYVRQAIQGHNEVEMKRFMALWSPAFEGEIASAERADALNMIVLAHINEMAA